MKNPLRQVSRWLILLMLTDLIFIFLIWILRPGAFWNVSVFIILFTVMLAAAGFWLEYRRRRRILDAARRFLDSPDEENCLALTLAVGGDFAFVVKLFWARLSEEEAQINAKTTELTAYREYIEGWVHEIKTPLSLAALVIDNHREEMSPYVYAKMNYVQRQLGENVDRILYYARLQTDHADYRYSRFDLDRCVLDALEEYRELAEENRILLHSDTEPVEIISDRKVLLFMISQLLGNAMKYADGQAPEVSVSVRREDDTVFLAIRDNGKGVPPEDAPFLFDKGFTGSHPNRQKATGMGLYLVKKYAEKLCVGVELEPFSTCGTGFGIRLIFNL